MLMLMMMMKCQGAFTIHTVDDSDVSASDVKDECEVVGNDDGDDNLRGVHTVGIMTDECVDESDDLVGGIDDDCPGNCCRDVGSCVRWLVLCVVFITAVVCGVLVDLATHIGISSMVVGNNGSDFSRQLICHL